MRTSVVAALAAFIVSTTASSVFAQTQADKVPEVIVQGSRDHVDPTRKFVDNVTAEVRDKNGDQQIAKFLDAVCPWTLGLTATQNATISGRVSQVAKNAGVRTGAKGCEPNVVVIIADTGHQLLEKLHAAHPAIFGAMDWHDIALLLREDGPVHTWQIRIRSSRDGTPLGLSPDGSPSIEPVNSVSATLPYDTNYLWSPSVIQKGVRQTLSASFVVIDAKAVDGLTLAQIADYAAMRTLAITRAPKRAGIEDGTILTLFDQDSSSAKPQHLSTADAAYLHALYVTSNAVSGTMQRASIINVIRDIQSSTPTSKSSQ